MESQFNFRLQKLLDIRIQQEENSRVSFQNAQMDSFLAEERLCSLQENYNKYNNEDYEETVVHKKIKRNYLYALTKYIEEAEIEAEEKEKNLEKCREELKDRQIERKTIEKLKEKKYDEFIFEENQREQKINDEFALYGYIKRTAERR